MGAVQRAIIARMIDGVTSIRTGEWRAARALQRRGVAVIYCNRQFVPVLVIAKYSA